MIFRFANYLRSKGRPTAVLYKEKKFIKKEGLLINHEANSNVFYMIGKYYSGGDGKRVITSRNIRVIVCVCLCECVCLSVCLHNHINI